MKQRILFLTFLAVASLSVSAQKRISASSPDGQTTVCVTLSDRIYYDVQSHGETVLQQCHVGMTLSDRVLGEKPSLKGKQVKAVKETITPIHPLKFSQVDNNYTLLTLRFASNYSVEWRVYDDGVAYRFVTRLPGMVDVMSEDATWQLAQAAPIVMQQPGGFKTSNEEAYTTVRSDEWKPEDRMAELPILVLGEKQKMLFSEFDLFDYPGLFLKSQGNNTFAGIQPPCPLEYEDDGDRRQKILKQADYIARTEGTRTFPWRYVLITREDGKLAESTMPTRLAPASVIGDASWVGVGQTCWDWLNGIPYGPDVTFKGGINLETYKYFIDFAERNKVKYILMDEGWALNTRDPFHTNPQVHLPEIIAYGKSKGVGVILWLPWLTVEHHMDLFKQFADWGIVGVKIDFMDRQDQWMVNFLERVAVEAAKNHIFVDFHGAFHPSGLDYKYPNILTFEGVRGMEFNGNCRPDNSLWLPFMRNAVGPMDYTPGSMLCYQPELHHGNRPICAGVGTKAYNMALFVLFESNLQMLMDNPCRYDMWPDCRDFLVSVPVNWDETRVLAAEAGQYIVTAKRKGDEWFIGAITNSTPRELTVSLDFLPAGSHRMVSFADGINADRMAMDYISAESDVDAGTQLTLKLARNGGFTARIK